MLKDIAISIQGALILSGLPWINAESRSEKIIIIIGLSAILFIFLLFLEEAAEKVRRVRKIRQILKRLQSREAAERADG